MNRLALRTAVAAMVPLAVLSGCAAAAPTAAADPGTVNVVTTTAVLADLAANVAGDRADVISLVPEGGDPHSYEPSLRDIRNVVYADVAFSNYLMLEEQNLIKALDTNLPPGVPNISLAEEAVKYAAEIIPLVEDLSLDTIWLGLRVQGDGAAHGADRTADVRFSATGVDGPGNLVAYLTGSFGDVDRYFDSSDGFDPSTGFRDDTVTLPPDAHTHLSWAFTEPGYYTLDLQAKLQVAADQRPIDIAADEVVFAVGVDPYDAPGRAGATVLDAGHSDLTLDLDTERFELLLDHEHGSGDVHQETFDLDDVVVEVPNKALHEIPGDPAYRFLGRPGEPVYQLPQAVLGKHVHGEIDPHLWQNVRNAMAYVEIMRDTLIETDPEGAVEYSRNAAAYLAELAALDAEIRDTIGRIPRERRTLVTTHDAFGYLGQAYDVTIAGFVTPNPAVEPSLAERKRLTQTIRNLDVPAVFLEPNLAARSSTLVEVATEQHVAVCPIYGDAFTEEVTSYVDMMRFNAHSLHDCLSEPEEDR
ncbi:anchored repeat ABC transporter, substrate-binding protein [Agromyces aerolatus]|uniref:anchored repeat ABC transporter, substrate-binding protein n=1 Tax=Agromyces sp. LY-1074 TaxID=3074080 RepID=UPI0028568BCB|nr:MULTISPECIES: anchored repeat ABC transporter, substrate-binding protein [unclassified Agromyces]MDR5700861.1 anchored repeat ABC transporter, substrate-binding protein [Agromyces sp. LY-1074]MDR5707478.1 anchored repeat ABC transporter, substrate-binding protein [Agromyces sp. LY-1358]